MDIGTVIEFRKTSLFYRIGFGYGIIIEISDKQFYEDSTFWETMYKVRCFVSIQDTLKYQTNGLQIKHEYMIEESEIHDEYYILDTGKINNFVVLSSI